MIARIKREPTIIDEKTRISLQTNNLWAILVSAVVIGISWASLINRIDLLNQKLDFVAQRQDELSQEFKEWKKQEEKRISDLEVGLAEVKSILKVR
jgi:uncharacterized membrane protein (DUF106 family)